MKVLFYFSRLSNKFLKGIFALFVLNLLVISVGFIFESCQKGNIKKQITNDAASKFNSSISAFRNNFGNMNLRLANVSQSRITETEDNLYYLDFPDGTSSDVITNFISDINLQTLTNVLASYGVSIDDSLNLNAEVVVNIPEEPIRQALNPLAQDAKNYLYSKGVTDQQINDLLIEENAEEIDLIPFVKQLIAIEEEQLNAKKNIRTSFPFVSQANAEPNFLTCGIAALGGDALYALAATDVSSWSWPLMKSAFKKVAQRFLGPIGVAIAVVSFTICMLDTP
jgi:hypothetical protein